jgi:hypothetical protein
VTTCDRFLAPLANNRQQGWHYTDPDWRLPSISLSQDETFERNPDFNAKEYLVYLPVS